MFIMLVDFRVQIDLEAYLGLPQTSKMDSLNN